MEARRKETLFNYEDPSLLRETSANEHALLLSRQVMVSILRLENAEIDTRVLGQAVHLVQSRHPLLRSNAKFTASKGRSFYVALPEDAQVTYTVVHREDEDHWKRVAVEETFAKLIPESKAPLWQYTVVTSAEGTELFFTYHHGIADEYAGLQVHHDVLTVYDLLYKSHNEAEAHHFCKSLDLNPPISELCFPSGPTLGDKWTLATTNLDQKMSNESLTMFPDICPYRRPYVPTNHGFEFDNGTKLGLETLQAACIRENVTVYAAIMSAIAFHSAYYQVSRSPGDTKFRVQFDMDVNLRGRVLPPVAADHVFNAYGIADLDMRFDGNVTFWDLARQYHTTVTNKVDKEKEAHYFHPVFERLLHDRRREYEDFLDRFGGIISSLNVCEVGKYPYATKYGHATVRDVYMIQNVERARPGLMLWIHSVDYLCFSLFFEQAICSDIRARSFLEDVRNILEGEYSLDEQLTLNKFFEKKLTEGADDNVFEALV
eukprot:GILK01004723.1.p1 GENE.GILK01004723.1~~GILK01004723.1.p1  ORF type:complete len:498 (-),score=70.16 GILK01004723.1:189-1652(-)